MSRTSWIGRLRAGLGFAWLALLAALVAVALLPHVVRFSGGDAFVIRGGSMEPTIPLGSLILVQPIDPDAVTVNDVITVRSDNGVVYSHRVSQVIDEGAERRFQLRGDANESPDGRLVPARALIGRVEGHLPLAGYLVALLSVPSGVMSLLSMLGSLLLATWLLEDLESSDAGGQAGTPQPLPRPA